MTRFSSLTCFEVFMKVAPGFPVSGVKGYNNVYPSLQYMYEEKIFKNLIESQSMDSFQPISLPSFHSPHCVVDGSNILTVTPVAQGFPDVGQVDWVSIH